MGVRKFSNRHALFNAIHSSIQKKMRDENWEKGSTTHNGWKWFPIQIQIMCTKVGSNLVRKHVTVFVLFFWLLAFRRYISNFIVRRCIIKKGFVGLSQILTVWLNGCIYGGNVWYSLKLDRYCAAAVRYDTQIPFHFHFYKLHSLFFLL